MAILGFHFSDPYCEPIYNGDKTATVMVDENYFRIGQEVQVYLSQKDNLLEGREEERIGTATIKKVEVKKVKELTDEEAKKCSADNKEDLKEDLGKWYGADEETTITYIEFDLELF